MDTSLLVGLYPVVMVISLGPNGHLKWTPHFWSLLVGLYPAVLVISLGPNGHLTFGHFLLVTFHSHFSCKNHPERDTIFFLLFRHTDCCVFCVFSRSLYSSM